MKQIVVLIVAITACLAAQTPTATITGAVHDPSGGIVLGAKVIVRNLGTGITHDVTTNKDGEYTVPLLDVGQYEVNVEAPGFKKEVKTGITLQVDQTARIDFSLSLGQISDVVEVTTQAPLTQTESSTVGTVVDNKHVVEMPLNGRQFYSLAQLVPGTTPPVQNSTLSFRGGFNVAGASEVSNNYTLNGFNNNDLDVSAPNFRPSIDAIQEFKLLTGVYPAEYGYGSGGQVNVTLKSGSNQFHGDLFEFLRNSYMDARNFFLSPTIATPPFRRNQFGGTLGGPIVKNKTFFFFSYEGLRLRQDIESLATVPEPQFLNGNFSSLLPGVRIYDPSTYNPATKTEAPFAGNVIPASRLSPVGQALLGYYPTPTYQTAAGTQPSNNYLFSEIRRETMNEDSLRIDHTFSEKDTLRLTANYFNDPSFEPSNTLCSARVLPLFGCYTNQRSELYGLTETHVFSPTMVNEFRAGVNILIQPRIMQDDYIPFNQTYGLNAFYGSAPYNNGVPAVSITSYSTVGSATNIPQNRFDATYILGDSLVWSSGKHTFKFGVDASQFRANQYYVATGLGSYSFTNNTVTYNPTTALGTVNSTYLTSGYGLADVLLGYPATSTRNPTAPKWFEQTTTTALFAQDDYKITNDFTLNYGLRWEVYKPVTEKHNQMASFDPIIGGMLVAGQNGQGSQLWNTDWHNFAPRLGFSWQPFHDAKTVIRGGAGIFYNAMTAGNGILQLFYNPPIRSPQTYNSTYAKTVTWANPFPATATSTPLAPYGIAQSFQTATIDEWSFGVERALTNSLVLDLTYFGSKGTYLPQYQNLNQPLPSGRAGVTNPRPYTQYANILFVNSTATSSYNSLQAQLQQRYNSGLSFLSSFTWGHSIDDSNGTATSTAASSTTPQNSYCLACERGSSDFDVRYRFVFSPVYELPFGPGKPLLTNSWAGKIAGGWQVSALFSAQTGTPLTPYYTSNISGTLEFEDRPNAISNPNNGPKTPAEWFNTGAFVQPAPGTFGNAGRNIIRGPGLVNLDVSIVRSFKLTERFALQLRGEAFNSLNHPNFNYPNATAGTAAFGTITSAQDPRELEFAMKLVF